jgi:hypothetical protein
LITGVTKWQDTFTTMGAHKIGEAFAYLSKRNFPCHWLEFAASFRTDTT